MESTIQRRQYYRCLWKPQWAFVMSCSQGEKYGVRRKVAVNRLRWNHFDGIISRVPLSHVAMNYDLAPIQVPIIDSLGGRRGDREPDILERDLDPRNTVFLPFKLVE